MRAAHVKRERHADAEAYRRLAQRYIDYRKPNGRPRQKREINAEIEHLKGLMSSAAAAYDFEGAIKLRDRIAELKRLRGEK